jgi:hypothetical protein
VTLQMVEKFGAERMSWVVEALFDDLLDWNDWFLRKRLKPPLNMVINTRHLPHTYTTFEEPSFTEKPSPFPC